MVCSFLTEAKPNNTVLERITVEDGLSQASVLAIAQDKQGYLYYKPLSAADFIEKLEENSVEIKAIVAGADASYS